MLNHRYIVLLIFLQLTRVALCDAQTPYLDSLQVILASDVADTVKYPLYNIVIFDLSRINSDSALVLSKQHMALAKENDNYREEVVAHYNFAVIYRNMGKYEEALPHIEEYLTFRRSINDTIGIGHGTFQLGLLHRQRGRFSAAIEAFNENIEVKRYLNDSVGLAIGINGRGAIYGKMGDYRKAIEEHEKALKINIALKRSSGIGACYHNIGNAYAQLNQDDQALIYYEKFRDLTLSENNKYGLATANEAIAQHYIKLEEYDVAEPLLLSSLKIREDMGHLRYVSHDNQLLARVYTGQGNPQQAIAYARRSLDIAEDNGMLEEQKGTLNVLAAAYKELGNYREAYDFHVRYKIISDSILNKDIANQIAEMNTRFETKEKNNQITQLEIEKQVQQGRINVQRLGLVGAIGGLGLLGFFFTQVKKKNIKIESQNSIISNALSEKEYLLKEIHHRVKNNLQVISSLLKLQSKSLTDEQAQQALDDGRSRVRSMALIHQNLYQEDNLAGVKAEHYLRQLVDEIVESYKIRTDKIAIKLVVDDLLLDVETLVPLGLITNELVSNSFKYAFEGRDTGELSISLTSEAEGVLHFSVEDDGRGFNAQEVSSKSFGIRLIRAFADRLHAEYSIENQHGTKARFVIKDYKRL